MGRLLEPEMPNEYGLPELIPGCAYLQEQETNTGPESSVNARGTSRYSRQVRYEFAEEK